MHFFQQKIDCFQQKIDFAQIGLELFGDMRMLFASILGILSWSENRSNSRNYNFKAQKGQFHAHFRENRPKMSPKRSIFQKKIDFGVEMHFPLEY